MGNYQLEELRYFLRLVRRKWSKPLCQISVTFFIAIGTVTLWPKPEGQQLDLWVLRHFFQWRGPRLAPRDVVLVAIDDETYEHLEASTNFPLPRHYVADALESINSASPKVVILDAKIPAQPNMEPEADDRIEAALRSGSTSIWTGEIPAERSEISSSTTTSTVINRSEIRFRNAAKMELPMTVAGQDETVMYVSYDSEPDATLYQRAPIARALVELAKLDIDAPGPNDLINFYGPAGTFERVPLYRLIGNDASAALAMLRDKIILLGYQSPSRGRGVANKDEYNVTVSRYPMFGLEIHANIVGNLIDRSWLRRPSPKIEQMRLFLTTLFVVGLAMHLERTKGVAFVAVAACLSLLLDYYAFFAHGYWLSGVGTFLCGCVVTVFAVLSFGIASTERFRKRVERLLGFNMSGY